MNHTTPPRSGGRRFDPVAFRAARQDAGWSIAELSAESGIPKSTLDKLAQGQRQMPRGTTYRRLIRALRLQKGALLTTVTVDPDPVTEEA